MATGSINISSNISRNTLLSTYAPKPCTKFIVKNNGNGSALLYWNDPEDYVTADSRKVSWKFTRIVRKLGSYPQNENDGTIVVDSSIRNQYSNKKFIDTGLSNYTTYYYSAFTCSTDNVYNYERVGGSIQIYPWRTMTVVLNLLNSNPSGIGSYSDDAVDMESGSSDWDKFFGYRPCLFKDGKVVGYLNPNDFSKFENGTAADITSGNAGDVMIEFPRRGVRISKSSGSFVTVSMTDNPDDPSFKYYAHQRGSNNKEYFYIGAYAGCIEYGKLVSLSNKTIKTNMILNTTLSECYRYGVANGEGYGCICYYQWLFIQVMYVLQFKGNLNSQNTVGKGCNDINVKTGTLDKYGLIYGEDSYGMNIKLFGLESMWSHGRFYINNYVHGRQSNAIQTTTDDTITDPALYEYQDYSGIHTGTGGWMSDCIGTTESGFSPVSNGFNGSSSTYFCDEISASFDNYILAGGGVGGDISGIFSHDCSTATRDNIVACGSHLQYL